MQPTFNIGIEEDIKLLILAGKPFNWKLKIPIPWRQLLPECATSDRLNDSPILD